MGKTEMTKAIEDAILRWMPVQIGDVMINAQRKQHTALEVCAKCGTTKSGIVDAVRVSEYVGDLEYRNLCRVTSWNDKMREHFRCPIGYTADDLPCDCEQTWCKHNTLVREGKPKILVTCIEIKVTKSDFKSEHGHNFVGNMNFYAVPEELFAEIEPLVPPNIGILVYLHKGKYIGLRTKRKPMYMELTDEAQKWLILSVMKRIREMDYMRFIKAINARNQERSDFDEEDQVLSADRQMDVEES